MKTKIIYISGNEVFEMAQIRAAFEEVRSALGLDNDTILFGVPVDQDNALANTTTETPAIIQDTPVKIVTEETIKEESVEEIVEENEPEFIPETAPIVTAVIDGIPAEEQIIEATEEETTPTTEKAEPEVGAVDEATESDTVIPILSILSTNDEEIKSEDATEPEIIEEEIAIVAEPAPEQQPETMEITDTLSVSIDDIVADEAPVETHEKTLEELLESMTPLGEDIVPEPEQAVEEEIIKDDNDDFSISMTDDATDTDATLAQLANEFAQTQDKIPDTPKASNNGKIGKLKNILPFKKAKRDDNGLMGDLFGWAGIAANDEDFSIPGFFTGAVGQK